MHVNRFAKTSSARGEGPPDKVWKSNALASTRSTWQTTNRGASSWRDYSCHVHLESYRPSDQTMPGSFELHPPIGRRLRRFGLLLATVAGYKSNTGKGIEIGFQSGESHRGNCKIRTV
eukprot:718332-Pyramimonas_sp.AAC.1